MKKALLLILILLLGTSVFAMGERVERGQTESGTPIFENAYAQFTYAQEKFSALQEFSSSTNMHVAAAAFRDFRTLYPNEQENVLRSYFFEAKSYYLGNEFGKFTEVYTRFTEKVPSRDVLTGLQAEGALLHGLVLQKQADLQTALTSLGAIEKDFPQEKKTIIAARRAQYDCLLALGRTQEAIALLEDTLDTCPVSDQDRALFGLTIALEHKKAGNKEQALEALRKVMASPETTQNKGPRTAAKILYEEMQK